MLKILSDKVREHIRENMISYIILVVMFSLGVVGGAYIFNLYKTEDVNYLNEFFLDAKDVYIKNPVNYLSIFKNSFLSSFKNIFLLWIMGFTVLGIPLVFFIILKKGFILGLISNFILSNFKNSLLLDIILIFSQTVILIPLMMAVSTYSISLSYLLIRMVRGKIRYKLNLKNHMLLYLVILIISIIVLIIYSFVEAYFTGNILKWYFSIK
ncbi:MAG: stage II sporulation protein M [Clostridia bacterium]|nr:stage II sporulation protein M [Clostridia bacterium]